jgi:hypothetical protein
MTRSTIPQQITHLEAMAGTVREDLAEAREGLLAKPGDERLVKQVSALEGLLKGMPAKVERLRRQELTALVRSSFASLCNVRGKSGGKAISVKAKPPGSYLARMWAVPLRTRP